MLVELSVMEQRYQAVLAGSMRNEGSHPMAIKVGDGAVGLCGVIAAKRLGAERIILLGSYPDRITLGTEFGATDVVSERGDEAVERISRSCSRTSSKARSSPVASSTASCASTRCPTATGR